jgi:hypothetical protein
LVLTSLFLSLSCTTRLFPIREHGMNMQSQVLQLHEIEGIKADPEVLDLPFNRSRFA